MFVHRVPLSGRFAVMVDRHQVALACTIASAFLMALHTSFGFTIFHFDAGHYWGLASIENLSNMPSSRGYVFPALLAPLHYLCSVSTDPLQTYRMGMSIIYGVALTTVVPAAFRQAFGGRVSVVRRLVPTVLLASLFPGLLLYPLSDLPAVLLTLAALMCALRGLEASTSRNHFIAMLVAAGVLMGAAYNTRTIYLFAGIPLGLLAVVTLRRPWFKAPFPRWLGLLAFVAGVVAVSLPQGVINKRTHGVNSLAVQSVVNNRSLFATQLAWGMTLQRYETTVNRDVPWKQVFYFDPDGARLFDDAARGGDLFSLPYYLKVVGRHPIEFLALYARHLVNGLDVRDGLVYTHKASPRRTRTAVFNFLVLALAAWVAVSIRGQAGHHKAASRPAPRSWPVSLALMLLPVAAILPGAIETRFFLPVHLLAYCVIAMHFDGEQLRRSFKQHGRVLLLSLVLAAGIFFAVTSNTMSNLRYDWPLIYRVGPPK